VRCGGARSQLRALDLERNALTGAVPSEWRQLQRLRSVKLRENKLCEGDKRETKKAQAWLVEKLHKDCRIELADEEDPPP
jgi:hypothetical protein